jgi:hypothetical protein
VKIIKTIEESDAEGLMALIGQRVTFFCMNYIWTGDLVGVNDVQVKLDNPAIVYETGDFKSTSWKDAQSLPKTMYIQLSAVEAYGVVK